jgi:hypothetical protein
VNLSRVAAKQLTASDLTFFAALFHRPGQRSKQKAINLNADVFVAKFYPGLRDRFTELHFGLTIVGPGAAPPYVLSRKALRTEGAKNWRLDGELINDPADQPGRFDGLAEGDVAILAFEGTQQPHQVVLVLLSATADAELHMGVMRLAEFEGRESMRTLDEEGIRDLLFRTRARYHAVHPLESLLTADSVEEAIYGAPEAQDVAIESDGRGVLISPESVRRQATTAGETGQLGEEAFERWLINEGHAESDFEWVSRTHGRAAFDFEVSRPGWERSGGPLYVDVKATRGVHASSFHMSSAELRWAATHSTYRIGRLAELTATSAEVRILAGVSEIAGQILEALRAALPIGVKVDSVEIAPGILREVHASKVEWDAEK